MVSTIFGCCCMGLGNSPLVSSIINLYISFALNKFLVPLSRIDDTFKDQYSNQKGIY